MKPIEGANILDSSDFTTSEAQIAVLKLLQPEGAWCSISIKKLFNYIFQI